MNCVIKNIPPPTFGIVGNRGMNFPTTEASPYIATPFTFLSGFMAKEEDINWAIYTQFDKQIAFDGLSSVEVIPPLK